MVNVVRKMLHTDKKLQTRRRGVLKGTVVYPSKEGFRIFENAYSLVTTFTEENFETSWTRYEELVYEGMMSSKDVERKGVLVALSRLKM